MALEDFLDSEVGIAVAATAVVLSPRARSLVRRGIVYGLAGALRAGDALSGAARGVAGEVQQTAASGVAAVQETTTEARTTARNRRSPRTAQGE